MFSALEQQPVPEAEPWCYLDQGHGAVPGVPGPSTETPGLSSQAQFHARALHISGLKANIAIVFLFLTDFVSEYISIKNWMSPQVEARWLLFRSNEQQ